MCAGPVAAVKTGVWAHSTRETGGAALTWSRFYGDKDEARTCAWIQDHTWHECEKKNAGVCKRHRQRLTQSCEIHSGTGFSLSVTLALLAHLEGARLLQSSLPLSMFRYLPSSSFLRVRCVRGSAWALVQGDVRAAPQLLQPAVPWGWTCCGVTAKLRPPAVPPPTRDMAAGSPGGCGLHGRVCLASAFLQGMQKAKAETWQPGELSLLILNL